MSKLKPKIIVWVLKYDHRGRYWPFGESFWHTYSRWPYPNGRKCQAKLFKTAHEAQEFLFKHAVKGRDVGRWKPVRADFDKMGHEYYRRR